MADKKLFITGATGYIGGSVLTSLVKQYPSLHVTALLRVPSPEFKELYPNVAVVKGTFDDFSIIEKASFEADIVIHTGDIDHAGCVSAIISGLEKKTTPSFLIHLTGTGCISDEATNTWNGSINPKIWDDISDLSSINSLPDSAFHRKNDRLITEASRDSKDGLIKSAIVCPPDIYGQGKGVSVKGRGTYLVPMFVRYVLEKKESFWLGEGENMRAVTHIDDVVSLFMILVGEAIKGGGKAQWGIEGFYFAVTTEVSWKSAAAAINDVLVKNKYLPENSKAVSWTKDQVSALNQERAHLLLYLWGSNSRADSKRAKALGWVPKGQTLWQALEEDVNVAVEAINAEKKDGGYSGLADLSSVKLPKGKADQ